MSGETPTYSDYVSRFADVQIEDPKPKKGCCGRPPKDDGKEQLPTIPLSRMLGKLSGKYKAIMVFGTIFSIMQGIVFPIFSLAFGELFNIFFEYAGDPEGLRRESATIAFIFLGLAAYNLVFGYLSQMMWGLAGEKLGVFMREEFFAAVIKQEVGYFDDNQSGRLVSMLSSDIEQIRSATGNKVSTWISFMTQVVVAVIIAFVYSWQLTLVLIAISPLMGIGSVLQMKMIANGTQSQASVFAEASSLASETIRGFRTVASFVWQGEAHRRYHEKLEKSQFTKGVHLSGLAFGLSFFFMFVVYALGFWWGSELIARGELAVGDMLIVFFSIVIGAMGFGQASTLQPDFAKGRGAAAAVVALLQRKPLVDPNPSGVTDPNMQPDVRFEDVQFRFPSRDVQVLKGLNFHVPAGATVGCCGSSGAGKSTIVALMERFYDADSGSVKIGGRDIRDYNLHWLRGQIGLVSQEPTLFNTTIRENIIFGKQNATMEEIEAAARAANAYDFIMELPDAFETEVGEGGGGLSGGQKQRIAIARAILKDPKVLLLDEATASLDNKSEAIVQDALDRVMQGRTTFVIAHRLATIRNADLILVMDDGVISELGPHWQLLSQRGLYYSLVVRQMTPEDLRDLEVNLGKYERGEITDVSNHDIDTIVKESRKPLDQSAEAYMQRSIPTLEKQFDESKYDEWL